LGEVPGVEVAALQAEYDRLLAQHATAAKRAFQSATPPPGLTLREADDQIVAFYQRLVELGRPLREKRVAELVPELVAEA
jgi:hypothetical protein